MEIGLAVATGVALVVGLASLGLSLWNLLQPKQDIADVRSAIRGHELELSDLNDRLSHWQRRDASRARRVAGDAPNEQRGPDGPQLSLLEGGADGKAALRARARAAGVMR